MVKHTSNVSIVLFSQTQRRYGIGRVTCLLIVEYVASLNRVHIVHYSPDFRGRAPSNASSTGRLSPIFSEQLSTTDYGLGLMAEQGQTDQLAGSLAQTVCLSQPLQTLESYRDVFVDNRPPPPPYCSLSIQSCPIHGYQGCSCFNLNNQLDNTYIKQVRAGNITLCYYKEE